MASKDGATNRPHFREIFWIRGRFREERVLKSANERHNDHVKHFCSILKLRSENAQAWKSIELLQVK